MTTTTIRSVSALLLAFFLGGCAGRWTPLSDAPRLLARRSSTNVRLITVQGDTVVMQKAVLRGDSVVSLDRMEPRSVALGDVASAAMWRGAAERTLSATALTLAGVLFTLGLGFLIDPPLQ